MAQGKPVHLALGCVVVAFVVSCRGCSCGCSDTEREALAAALRGDHARLATFLVRGMDPGMECWTAEGGRAGDMHSLVANAVLSRSWETVKLLVGSPQHRDHAFRVALAYAQLEIAEALLRQGARFDRSRSYFFLEAACDEKNPARSDRLFDLLIQLGVDVDARSPTMDGSTILIKQAHVLPDRDEAVAEGFARQMRNLERILSLKPDLNLKDREGTTALMNAAQTHHGLEIMKLLLERGADPNLADSEGRTVLMRIVREVYSDDEAVGMIRLLARHGADLNAPDRAGESPLSWAATRKTGRVSAVLVALGGRDSGKRGASSAIGRG